MPTYSVETRVATRGGNDYQEQHEEFDTPEQVKKYISELEEDESVHSVLRYADGENSNPKCVTNDFRSVKRKR